MIKFMVDSGSDYDVNEAKEKMNCLFLCQLLLIMIHIKMELK